MSSGSVSSGPEPAFRHRTASLLRAAANDLKRDDASADAELGLPPGTFARLASGQQPLTGELLERVCRTWPLNERDLLPLHDDCPAGVLVCRQADSLAGARILARGGRPYYEYRDTATSRLASYRPEWIRMLQVVDGTDPADPAVQWNEGHLLYQFTYFVGPVNYYYRWQETAHCVAMSTGDSVWGIPFAPHSFAARTPAEPAYILALTYGGDLVGDAQRELAVLGAQTARELALPAGPAVAAQAALLRSFLRARLLTPAQLAAEAKLPAERVAQLCAAADLAREDEIHALARALRVPRRELLAPETHVEHGVRVQRRAEAADWDYPGAGQRSYRVTRLAGDPLHPHTTGLELAVLAGAHRDDSVLHTYQHQYLYVLGEHPVALDWQHAGRRHTAALAPGDSAYVRPQVPLTLCRGAAGPGRVLLLRIGGAAGTDVRFALSAMADGGIERYLDEDRMWYRTGADT